MKHCDNTNNYLDFDHLTNHWSLIINTIVHSDCMTKAHVKVAKYHALIACTHQKFRTLTTHFPWSIKQHYTRICSINVHVIQRIAKLTGRGQYHSLCLKTMETQSWTVHPVGYQWSDMDILELQPYLHIHLLMGEVHPNQCHTNEHPIKCEVLQ